MIPTHEYLHELSLVHYEKDLDAWSAKMGMDTYFGYRSGTGITTPETLEEMRTTLRQYSRCHITIILNRPTIKLTNPPRPSSTRLSRFPPPTYVSQPNFGLQPTLDHPPRYPQRRRSNPQTRQSPPPNPVDGLQRRMGALPCPPFETQRPTQHPLSDIQMDRQMVETHSYRR